MGKDNLGKRMKEQYEMRTRTYLPRRTYTIIRLDGKSFHTYTRGFNRPYDEDLMRVIDETTKFLCKEIQGAKLAYTQSDEISILLTDFDKIETEAWFDGQVQKMVSVAASLATGKFNQSIIETIVRERDRDVADKLFAVASQTLAFFDARVFTIPNPVEVENYFIWRQKDAMRNAISMVAQSIFSHKQLQGKSTQDMKKMIETEKNLVDWSNLVPPGFKLGRTFYKSEKGWRDCLFNFVDEMQVNGNEDQRVITQFIPKISYV